MPEFPFFRDLVLAVGAALVGGVIAQRLGQPPLLGYLLGGILIGPYTPGPVSDIRHVSTLADMGIVLLMFELGVEFPVARIRRVRSVALGGGSAQVILTGVLAIGISRLLGLPLVQQVFFGAIVSLSSTVVILKLLLDRGEMDTPHGEISVGIALVQDLSLVAMMVLLPAWATAEEDVGWTLLLALGKTIGLFLGAYFVAGLLLPGRALFASLFFVSVGMLVDPLLLWRHPGTFFAVVAVIVLLKPAVSALIVRAFGHSASTALLTGLLLGQVGELSFVLARLGAARRFIGEELYGLVLWGALVSILVNPVLLRYGGALLARGVPRVAPSPAPSDVPEAGRSHLAGHVIICGCGRGGSELVAQHRAAGFTYVVIELNPIRIEELGRDGEPCLFGDANNLRILKDAGVERAKLLAITHYNAAASELTIRTVLEIHPALQVIARAHDAGDVQRLRGAGASEVVVPEFEAGMEFLPWTLGNLGLSLAEIESVVGRRRTALKPRES